MKTLLETRFRFLTACFCAGGDQKIAEIRPTALRAELRWWFRCLRGTREQEDALFGTAAGRGCASAIMVRISAIELSDTYHTPNFISPNDPSSYQHYFLTAPTDNLGGHTRMWERPPDSQAKVKGKIRESSQIPPGSQFNLQVIQTRNPFRSPEPAVMETLKKALLCLQRIGSLGYRKTRGFGAWQAEETPPKLNEFEDFFSDIAKYGFSHELGNLADKPEIPFNQIEAKLKGNEAAGTGLRRKDKWPAARPSPLGFSFENERQSSAICFRPIALCTKKGDTKYALLTFQAPDSVLGSKVSDHCNGDTRVIPETS